MTTPHPTDTRRPPERRQPTLGRAPQLPAISMRDRVTLSLLLVPDRHPRGERSSRRG